MSRHSCVARDKNKSSLDDFVSFGGLEMIVFACVWLFQSTGAPTRLLITASPPGRPEPVWYVEVEPGPPPTGGGSVVLNLLYRDDEVWTTYWRPVDGQERTVHNKIHTRYVCMLWNVFGEFCNSISRTGGIRCFPCEFCSQVF